MSNLQLSCLSFQCEECSQGVLYTVQPPKILEDGTVVWVQKCTKCDYERVLIQTPKIHKGHMMHNHGSYGWHPVLRKHREEN